jgi:hypothetical protein
VSAPQVALVTGMHRSGTSLLAGLYDAHGISMGTERLRWPRPNEENPRGFFEDVRPRLLNDLVLRRSHYRVKSWEPPPTALSVPRAFPPLATGLVRLRSRSGQPWGWKDPRQMLTQSAWTPVLLDALGADAVRFALVFRSPRSVARSMATRGNTVSEGGAINLWHAYHQSLRAAADQSPFPIDVVSYDELLAEPHHVMAGLLAPFDVPVDPAAVDRFLDLGLRRSGAGSDEDLVGLASGPAGTYRWLLDRSRS